MITNKQRILSTMMNLLFFIVCSAAVIAIASDEAPVAGAGKQHDGGHHHGSMESNEHHSHQGKHHHMMMRADLDQDGKISKEEYLKYFEAKFDKKDLNNDGFVDQDEMHQAMKNYMHGHGHEKKGHSAH